MKLESNERGRRGIRKWRLGVGLVALALVAVTGNADETAWQDRVNLNTGTQAEFGEIPGVGNRMVREFMEYRPYVSIRQFRREIGKYVSDEQVAALQVLHHADDGADHGQKHHNLQQARRYAAGTGGEGGYRSDAGAAQEERRARDLPQSLVDRVARQRRARCSAAAGARRYRPRRPDRRRHLPPPRNPPAALTGTGSLLRTGRQASSSLLMFVLMLVGLFSMLIPDCGLL